MATLSTALIVAAALVPSLAAADVVVLTGHDGDVASVAFSPDGRWLASGGTSRADHGAKLWDVATGKAVASYNPDVRGGGFSVAFAPGSKLLYVGDLGLSVRVVSVPDGKEKAAWPTSPDKGWMAQRVAASPDGKLVAGGLSDGTIMVFAAGSGAARKLSQGNAITALAFSPDSKLLAAGTDFGLRVWDAASGKQLVDVDNKAGKFEVKTVAFAPDGKTLVVGGSPGVVRFLGLDGKELRKFVMPSVGGSTTIDALVVSPDGKRVYCTGMLQKPDARKLFAGAVALDFATAKPVGVARLTDSWGDHITQLAVSPDGKRLAAAVNGSNSVYVVETASVVAIDKLPD